MSVCPAASVWPMKAAVRVWRTMSHRRTVVLSPLAGAGGAGVSGWSGWGGRR
ncbi:MAG: hypothetical protein QOE54_2137 [Streptosporangiaceae bacterium]|jgi:hypothetical protein|nr:hypothetical protein [Streptosporangiaceae bacterium]